MGSMQGWKFEINGLSWRYKNGQHPKEKRSDGTPATLNRVEIRIPAYKDKPAKTVFRPLGLDLPEETREVEAQKLIRQIMAQLGHDVPVTADTAKTIADLWPLYVRRLLLKRKAPSERNKNIFEKHILRLLGDVPLAEVNDSEYGERYALKRQEEGVADGTILREFTVIKVLMNSAVRKKVIGHNFLGAVELAAPAHREVVVPIPVIREIMSFSTRHLKRAIIMAVTTAQRQEKVWEMSAGRVFMHEDESVGLTLRQDKAKSKGKGNPEELPLSALAYAALTDGMAQLHPSTERTFVKWSEPRHLGQAFQDARNKALKKGVIYKQFLAETKLTEVTFHDLRHTANSMLMTNINIDYGARKKLLGHSLGIEDVYSHLWGPKLRQAVDFLGEVYRPLAAGMGYTDGVMKTTTASVTPIKQHHSAAQ